MPETETIDPIKQVILDMPVHIVKAVEIIGGYAIPDAVDTVLIIGMGGSGIAGRILKTYLRNTKLRVDVVNDYTIPLYVDKRTLVFVCSYSGNTEETVAAYKEASKRRAKCIGLFTGGKLKDIFKLNDNHYFIMPLFPEPRYSSPTMFFMMLRILENSKLIPSQVDFIKETIAALKSPKIHEVAYDLGLSLRDKTPLIYASDHLYSVAYRWKCDFNENSEVHAFAGLMPEVCHNELMGFRKKASDYHVIFLKDAEETAVMKKRFEVMKQLVKSRGFATTEILVTGSNELTRLCTAFLIGSLASYYLALEEKVEPREAILIKELKERLKR
ncbi:SIS domain-containing protein [Candidatus Woesearchaeota archaeon]|nr:SIS domain-containing protein [Candidatus Woesearchaeota archaeon]